MPSALLFVFKTPLAIGGLSWFCMNFIIAFSISVKSAFEILIGIALNL